MVLPPKPDADSGRAPTNQFMTSIRCTLFSTIRSPERSRQLDQDLIFSSSVVGFGRGGVAGRQALLTEVRPGRRLTGGSAPRRVVDGSAKTSRMTPKLAVGQKQPVAYVRYPVTQ